VVEVIKSSVFDSWLTELKDDRARARVLARIDRLAMGNPGDVKPVGEGVSELKIDYGPGYRLYYSQRGSVAVLLLCGGDKRTQSSDIQQAKKILTKYTLEAKTHGDPRKKK
jgi:putative addiction module killer protein